MRLFIGIELPADVKTYLAGIADRCRRHMAPVAPHAVLRWVPQDNLHITLWFLGDVDERRLALLMEALGRPFRAAPFTAQFASLGAYPPGGNPRVIWAGVEEGREDLQSLYAELAERLPALGFEPERRPYSPHVSLARVKDIPRSEGSALRAVLQTSSGEAARFAVGGLTLFRSRTLPSGSEYESLLRVPLK
jgi:2'-5' RNA ligase